jgi:hypothetical protein
LRLQLWVFQQLIQQAHGPGSITSNPAVFKGNG